MCKNAPSITSINVYRNIPSGLKMSIYRSSSALGAWCCHPLLPCSYVFHHRVKWLHQGDILWMMTSSLVNLWWDNSTKSWFMSFYCLSAHDRLVILKLAATPQQTRSLMETLTSFYSIIPSGQHCRILLASNALEAGEECLCFSFDGILPPVTGFMTWSLLFWRIHTLGWTLHAVEQTYRLTDQVSIHLQNYTFFGILEGHLHLHLHSCCLSHCIFVTQPCLITHWTVA